MTSYSSAQFYQDWRYAIEQDFLTTAGTPYPFAENGKQEWGDETKKISFGGTPNEGCISSDGKYLAVAVGHDIHIVDTATFDTITVLKGHISRVDALAFKPGDSNILVSSEQNRYGDSVPTVPTIIVWDIGEALGRSPAFSAGVLRGISSNVASYAATQLRESSQLTLDETELHDLAGLLEPSIARVVTKHCVAENIRINGRLMPHFQSSIFSPSGRWMVYLPGERPKSNSVDVWDIKICATDNGFSDLLTLEGHTDAIMWTGWNADESLIASVSWDKSIRIWDAVTGKQVHKFDTGSQNWTGAFSPDSKYFAATCVYIYSLATGAKHWTYNSGARRCRALAWHPDSQRLAVGCGNEGKILLLDTKSQNKLQTRTLSTATPPGTVDSTSYANFAAVSLGVSRTRFVDGGDKLVVWAHGDASIEIFDLVREVKWRFARGGTDPAGPSSRAAEGWVDEDGRVISRGGDGGMVVWEGEGGSGTGVIFLASLDFDAVRVWSL